MTTVFIDCTPCQQHDTGAGHPECAARLRAIDKALEGEAFAALVRRSAEPAKGTAVELAHSPGYFAAITRAAPATGLVQLDGDTVMSPGSLEAALRAVGAGLQAVDLVMTGAAENVFCAVRPPGHHAERARPMGFCLFSNVAIAALHAREAHGVERVAVVDFDVHHGNGTQDIFWSDRDLFYGSTHQMPLFPGTGAQSESGVAGNICNAPLRAGDGGAAFRAALHERIFPALEAFAPDLVLLSAGFDAHAADPLGGLELTAEDFAWVTLQLGEIAHRFCAGRMVSMLEGGYDLEALGQASARHIAALMEIGR